MTFRLEDHATRLQAMRGLAALSVAIGHCCITLPNGRIEQPNYILVPSNALLSLFELIFQPNTAVIFFYVLSGLVLGESLRRRRDTMRRQRFAGFLVRRLWRLVPGMWLSIAAAIIVMLVFLSGEPNPVATAFYNSMIGRPITVPLVLGDLVGWTYHTNPLLWSIQIELVLIPMLPAMLWLASRIGPVANIAVACGLALASMALWGEIPNALRFLYVFYLGVALPELIAHRRMSLLFMSGWITAAALVLLLPIEWGYVSGRLWMPYKFVGNTIISAQVLGFVLLRPKSLAARKLELPVCVWLGDISYSFYIFSFTAQLALATLLLPADPLGDWGATIFTVALILLTLGTTAAMAAVSFRWVEQRGITIGRHWSARIESQRELAAAV